MGLRAVIGGHGRAGGNGDLRRILFARGARGLASGYFAVVLGVELHHQGLSGIEVGLVLGAVLGGAAFALLGMRRFADGALDASQRSNHMNDHLTKGAAT